MLKSRGKTEETENGQSSHKEAGNVRWAVGRCTAEFDRKQNLLYTVCLGTCVTGLVSSEVQTYATDSVKKSW